MSNGSESIPERCVHAVDGPDWAGLRELPDATRLEDAADGSTVTGSDLNGTVVPEGDTNV